MSNTEPLSACGCYSPLMQRAPSLLVCFFFTLFLTPFLGAPVLGQSEDANETPPSEADAAQESDPRPRLELPVPAEDGGGVLLAEFDNLESAADGTAVLSGDVEIVYQDIKINAKRIEYDPETGRVFAEDGVTFVQGPRSLTGDSVEYNLDTKLGRFTNSVGSFGDDYYFSGALVEKVSDVRFMIEDGEFTSCEGENPSWSFRADRIQVTQDKYAKVKNARFKAGKVPVLYMPYMLWPVKEARTSGFLMPKPGYSSRRGASLSLAYFQALGRSYDTTFTADLYTGGSLDASATGTGEFLGIGNEFRYRPSENTEGLFEGYAVQDPEVDDTRWLVNYSHKSTSLPGGFRAVVKFEDASDFDYFQDYDRRGDGNSQRQLYSYGFLTKNWGANSINLKFDTRETFLGNNADGSERTLNLRQLPELEYKLRKTRIGKTPFYLEFESSAHMLDVERNERQDESYGRADIFPSITLPIPVAPWFSLSLNAGGRYTWYSDSLLLSDEKEGTTNDFRGESISRFVPVGSAEIIGPSFSKIFETEGEKYSKYKHLVEPRITYQFTDDYDDFGRVPRFDEIDRIKGRNTARYSIINRVLAKPRDESRGGARELLSLTVFQDHSFDALNPLQSSRDRVMTKSQGPLSALFRYNPSLQTNLRVDMAYNTLFGGLQSAALSGRVTFRKRDHVGVRWTTRRNVEIDETMSHQVRASTGIGIGSRWTVSAEVNYDVERDLKQLQRYFIDFKGCCFGLTLEGGDYRLGQRRDVQYRLLVNLRNVGSFLDINGGSSGNL